MWMKGLLVVTNVILLGCTFVLSFWVNCFKIDCRLLSRFICVFKCYFNMVEYLFLCDWHCWLMKMAYLLNWLTCIWYFTATRSTSDWPDWPRVCRCSLWLSREESSRGVDEEGWHSYPSEQLKQGSLTLCSFYCLLLNCSVTAFVIHIWITRQCFNAVGLVAGRASSL